MKKYYLLPLIMALILAGLMLAPLTDASRNEDPKRRSPLNLGMSLKDSSGPISLQAVAFAESVAVRDIAATETKRSAGKRDTQRVDREKAIERQREKSRGATPQIKGNLVEQIISNSVADTTAQTETEKNPMNREITRAFDYERKTAPEAAIAKVPDKSKKLGALAPNAMPTPIISFDGIGNPAGCGGCLPPDTNGEIGPTQFVQNVNSAWRVWNRAGTPLTPVISLGSLFASLPSRCAGTADGDPVIIYDQLADRWLISEFCWSPFGTTGPDHELIAISKTGDATGQYYLYDFVMPNLKFPDYPKIGVWPDGYYMTTNQFNQGGSAFQGSGVFAFDRTKMLAGDPTASFVYFDKAENCSGNGSTCSFGGLLPGDLEGFRLPPADAPNPLVQFDADEFNAATPDSLRILDFHVDFVTPANSTLIERTGSPLLVAAFDPREVPSHSRNVIPQPGGVAVDAITDRLMFRSSYRNMGSYEALVFNHTVNAAVNPAFRAGVRYYELRKTTADGAWVVNEQATMAGAAGDTLNRWMGATALNNAGSQAVGYSASDATTFTSVLYAGRLATDPAGSLPQGEATIIAGAGNQTSNSGRWGDYSDMTVDPVDDCTFWYTQEYYSATSASNWNTRIGSFSFGPCPAIQKGVLTGTVMNVITGNPIPNATVIASNGFSRTTNGSGVYNIDPMAADTVTLTVSAPNYATATAPDVTVTNGSTTTQNVQLVPLTTLIAGSGTVSADNCNANLTLDPNETVTVNLGIVNNGPEGATTTNLVGTLQETGGVIGPSGPQNYGAVVGGQPAVSRPFTFVVGPSCGGTVTATLQLQDGATNYGTRTFTFQVGILGGALRSTGDISVIVPDNNPAGVDIPIDVPDNLTISDVNVRFRANMTYDGDLVISLVHPDNTTVALATTAGEQFDDFGTGTNDCAGTPTVFDDAATTAIAAGTPPFAGSFKPQSPLAALNGKPANGTWKLHVVDTAIEDVAKVGCVTLEINKQFTCCGVDIAAGLPAYTLTAESITPANNAPDPDETVTVNFALKNNGGSDATDLVATLQPGGGVAAPSGPQSYGALASGATASRPFTFVAQGACAGTIAATLALHDGATALPPITITIPIGVTSVTTQSFSNSTAITIPATGNSGPASPYPSNIDVSGMAGVVTKVTVAIPSISHIFPSDVSMLLVGPGGQKYVFFSNVLGGAPWSNNNYILDDDAPTRIADGGTPVSGTFRPSNYVGGDTFPAPAPASPYTNAATVGTDTFASVFNGTNPNGTWSLYVIDDRDHFAAGQMPNGWTITITTQITTCNTQSCSLACPANVTVQSATPTVVNYSSATPTGACGVLNYSTPSGSTFPVGTTPVTVTGVNSAQCTFDVNVVPPLLPLIISEFRLRGPGGANDEYIELYNNSDSPINVSAIDASSGWALAASDGVVRFVIPNGTTIPARSHYLAVNSNGYSLGSYPNGNGPGVGESTRRQGRAVGTNEAFGIPVNSDISFEVTGPTASGDISYTTDIPDNAGISLFNSATAANFTLANRLDAVGSTSEPNALYREGAGYAPLSGSIYTGGINYAFVRDMCGKGGSMTTDGPCTQAGIPKDSNDNATDFFFVDTNGVDVGAGQRLGAPGPENSSAPVTNNSLIAALFDDTVGSSSAPNRMRNFAAALPNGPLGTVELRRTITNNTGGNITRLRFRVIDVTTFPALTTWADLRPVTSADVMVSTSGGTVLVRGTTLETPPSQGAGGGFNSSLSVGTVTLATPLANGASVNVRWVFGVQQTGTFRFVINVEALP